ncbi:hypothetical protein HELRODRAFT_70323, partial [Helobdella robusta]|uniref:G-protein coupled receptors family 1 profile domain-containing protein n=1 Tax=Helobdella robusta TaxID=6412 RepID=T1G047_HELRO
NLTVIITLTLCKKRQRRTRVEWFILNLAIADIFVALYNNPIEIAWAVTISWNAGDAACKILMFCRAFGFYLSSFILVAISFDRYFAVAKPLSTGTADERGKIMLITAWTTAVFASLTQVFFYLAKHPNLENFYQCVVTNDSFPNHIVEMFYHAFNFISVYFLPLVVIIVSYSLIIIIISKRSRQTIGCNSNRVTLRISGLNRIEQARAKTLKMTIVIVLAFIICWTPYYVLAAWCWLFQDSVQNYVNQWIQEILFIFAISNSCADPIIYGLL